MGTNRFGDLVRLSGVSLAMLLAAASLGAAPPAPSGSQNTVATYRNTPSATAGILDMPPARAYQEAFRLWAAGDQSTTEAALRELVLRYPADQPLAFFHAMCTRSRFAVREAQALFRTVVQLGPTSTDGQVAEIMLGLDNRTDLKENFEKLLALAIAPGADPLVIWAAAIECRTFNQPKLGVPLYRQLIARVGVGSSLVHQTFANVLDDAGLYDEALEHRKMAVRLEPSGWSYQGMANTLTSLKRFDEASDAYDMAVKLSPGSGLFWETWGRSLRLAGKYGPAIEKCKMAVRINPADTAAWENWGVCSEKLGRLDEALNMFNKSIAASPANRWAYAHAAEVLEKLGRMDEARVYREHAGSATVGE